MAWLRWPFTVSLPVAWAISSAISFRYPGDEYNLWGFSSIAGTWILAVAPTLHSGQHPRDFLPAVLTAGFCMMAVLGHLLDRLRSPRIAFLAVWIMAAAALTVNALCGYPSYQRAIMKNGSFQAYIFASTTITLTGAALLFLAVSGVIAIVRFVLSHRLPSQFLR